MSPEEKMEYAGLVEVYRIVSEDIRQYVSEMFRALPYAAVLAALYLGFGLQDDRGPAAQRIVEYTPYAFFLLALYFLVIAYIKTGLAVYRLTLERRLNELQGRNIFEIESFAEVVQARGRLRLGRRWYTHAPTPPLAFTCPTCCGSIYTLRHQRATKEKNRDLGPSGGCSAGRNVPVSDIPTSCSEGCEEASRGGF